MNKPLQNHIMLVNQIKNIFDSCNITSNQDDLNHYIELSKDRGNCHIELHGFSYDPIKIKTAYAEGKQSNQSDRYYPQIKRMHDEIIFVYDGDGWKKKTYRRALQDIRKLIGSDHVLNLQELEIWLKEKLSEM